MIDIKFIRPLKLKEYKYSSNESVIVSLTSYGRRVEKEIVYYTLVSLLRQSTPPDKIVINLDKYHLNYQNLPIRLKSLEKFGVEFNFCDDIRSYKKLIPSLLKYPDSVIITVDDDVIYRKDLIESLINAHELNKELIITRHCRFPILENGKFVSYSKWISPDKTPEHVEYIMPIGASGILYPPRSLHHEVFNQKVFQEICPIADDIWFWIMAKMKGTNHMVISQENSVGNSFDDLYQYFHKGSALTHTNNKKNLNDIQLNDVIRYYNINLDDLTQK